MSKRSCALERRAHSLPGTGYGLRPPCLFEGADVVEADLECTVKHVGPLMGLPATGLLVT